MSKDCYESIKVMTLGNSNVGKTSFIRRFTDDSLQEIYVSTNGIDFQSKILKLSNQKIYKLFIYDTAGQERYNSIAVNFIKNADGILLIYDITEQESFNSISNWMKDIEEVKGKNFPVVLIGNKADLENARIIKKEEGEELAKKYGKPFFETSCKNGNNIQEASIKIINIIIKKRKNKKELREEYKFEYIKDSLKLDKKNFNKKKKRKYKKNIFFQNKFLLKIHNIFINYI